MFIESGHPYKLTAVPGNQGPMYPWDAEHSSGAIVSRDGPPPNTPWTDYAYVIGGYGWKARWVKPDGKVYTTGTEAQLNLWANEPEWVPYHQDEDKPYNYSCFKCHTTGASEEGSWPEGTTDFGTFVFGGVQCEECHGQGSQHASDPPRFDMVVDTSPALCGRCHTRDPQNRVAVSGGYIRHHEQFDEMVHSPHAAIGCGAAECVSCHTGYDTNLQHSSLPTCTDCHMPEAAKSARVTDNPYVADVSSHTFMINTAAVGKSAMWTSDGKFLAVDEFGRGRVTLDFACYSCHKDDPMNPTNPTAPFSAKSLTELSNKAMGIHGTTTAYNK
jgi:predicted CXXCH cytochrome family protein